MANKTLTFLRPSGSTIELANTKEMKQFAKKNGFKLQKEQVQADLIGGNDGDSGAGSEGDTSGDSGTGG